jgi:hypothetical protein
MAAILDNDSDNSYASDSFSAASTTTSSTGSETPPSTVALLSALLFNLSTEDEVC